jgi:hypothetical protein
VGRSGWRCAAALELNSSLRELDVSGGVLNKELGARMLLGVIQAHPSLDRLCGLPLSDAPLDAVHVGSSFGFMGR